MPTLLETGQIILPKGKGKGIDKKERERVDKLRAVDYVMEQIGYKLNLTRDLNNNIKSWPDKITILDAKTGSGKTTTIAAEIFKRFHSAIGRNIINTMPLTASAIRSADEVSDIFNLKMGKEVGFQIGTRSKKPVKGVLFATIGILTQQLKILEPDQLMSKYSVIIVDEAHERSLNLDLVLYFLKALLKNHWDNPRCPHIIFMSATLDLPRFIKYFSSGKSHPQVITVAGQSYPIEEHFLDVSAGNYIWKIIDTAINIHKTNEDDFKESVRDILIFVNGKADTIRLINEFNKINETLEHKIYPMEFSSTVFREGGKALDLFEAPIDTLKILGETPKRKIIITTPAAESSITIRTLKYCIDSGFANLVEFDPQGYTTFIMKNITADSAHQRRGRVGRVAPGVWYPIYTKESYGKFREAKFPDIIITDVSPVILSLIVKDEGLEIEKLDMMDTPPGDALHYALEKLFFMGAINTDITPTETGRLMNRFRKLKLENIKMILSGYHFGANILDLITIAALSESRVCGRKYKPRQVVSDSRMDFLVADTFIDLIFLFEEFRNIVSGKNINLIHEWCGDNDVNFTEMVNVIKDRDSLIEDIVLTVGFDPLYNGIDIDPAEYSLSEMLKKHPDIAIDEVVKIKKCIYAGYGLNVAVLDDEDPRGGYKALYGKYPIAGVPKGEPRFFIYNNLLLRDNRGKFTRTYNYYSVIDGFYSLDTTIL